MKEITLRKYHRGLGLILILFLAIQGITGFLFSFSGLTSPPMFRLPMIVHALHHGYGTGGDIYRILLALGTLAQGVLGLWIYFRIKARSAGRQG